MESYVLVRQAYLNHHGKLFGGQLLAWIDEYTWIAATLDFPATKFVTRAMDRSEFKAAVPPGSILRFAVERTHVGTSSVTYKTDVWVRPELSTDDFLAFSTHVTLVSVDENGLKKPITTG